MMLACVGHLVIVDHGRQQVAVDAPGCSQVCGGSGIMTTAWTRSLNTPLLGCGDSLWRSRCSGTRWTRQCRRRWRRVGRQPGGTVDYAGVVTLSSESDRIRFVGDIDAEPEPLRSQLWALVLAGASELDERKSGGLEPCDTCWNGLAGMHRGWW